MKRLGVAALGMYNRRKVHILAQEAELMTSSSSMRVGPKRLHLAACH